jgi:hypothetical protein
VAPFSYQDYVTPDIDSAGLAEYFREQAIQRALDERQRAKLGYPTAAEPAQGVTPSDIPTQTGARPEPKMFPNIPATREEMVAANIQRTLGRDRQMLGAMVPGSFTQEQFVKELEGIKAMTTGMPETAAKAGEGGFSDILGEAKTIYDPEKGRYVAKFNLGAIDPRYGYQSVEAIESYLSRSENYPQVASTPRQTATAAARQAPVTPAPARAAARPTALRPGLTPGQVFMELAKQKYQQQQTEQAGKREEQALKFFRTGKTPFSEQVEKAYRP